MSFLGFWLDSVEVWAELMRTRTMSLEDLSHQLGGLTEESQVSVAWVQDTATWGMVLETSFFYVWFETKPRWFRYILYNICVYIIYIYICIFMCIYIYVCIYIYTMYIYILYTNKYVYVYLHILGWCCVYILLSSFWPRDPLPFPGARIYNFRKTSGFWIHSCVKNITSHSKASWPSTRILPC